MKTFLFLVFCVFFVSFSNGATIYIATTGNDATGAGTVGNPYLTLNKALTVAVANDIISVGAGTFSGTLNRSQTTAINLTIQGASLATTIFNCGSSGRWLSVTGTANVTISAMTIQNGSVAGNGGAINYTSSGTITCSNVAFSSCVSTGGNYGGAIYKSGGALSLTSSTFTSGSAGYGGAIYFVTGSGTSTITSCQFTNNTGTVLHGAIYHNAGTINYSKCKFNGNTSNPATHHNGAAISNWGATFTATNCLFYDNVTSTGGYYSGTVYQNSGTGTLMNCTLTENTGYFIVDNHTSGTFTITNSILYNNISRAYDVYDEGSLTMTYSIYQVETGSAGLTGCNSNTIPYFKAASSDNFMIGASSYAVNNGTSTGAPVDDYDGTTRANGSTTGSGYDIGCYENTCTSGTYYVNNNALTSDVFTSAVGSDSNPGTTGAPFLTLQKALNDCGCTGSIIYVDAGSYADDNMEVANTISIIGAGMSLTSFNGSTDAVSGERFMTLSATGNMTITNMEIKNMLTVSGNGAGLNVINSGTNTFTNLKIDACTVSGAFHGGGMYNTNTGTTITGCTFSNNSAPSGYYGGGIHQTAGALTVSNCTFTSNTAASGRGGGIYHAGTTLTVSGSIFTSNTSASGNGGAIYHGGTALTISNTTFTSNTANSGNGGAINHTSGSALTISSCTFTSNTATGGYGAGIYKTGGLMSLTSNTITGGTAGYGGAIYHTTGSGTSTITSCIFTNNTGTVLHGAVYHNTGTINYSKCKFNGNTSNPATHHNGAAISNWGATFTATNCLFYDNVTSTGGYYSGTVYQNSGTGTLQNCTLTENTGYFIVDNHTTGTFTIKNTILYNNISRAYDVYDEGALTMTYSIYQVETGSAGLTGCTSYNPNFKGASSDDFTIGAASYAADNGISTGAPTDDYDGTTRANGSTTGSGYDIGCYENSCTVGTYYVNNNALTGDLLTTAVGNDSNLGTSNAPYLTLRKALNNCGCSGSTIYVDAGTYSDDDLEVSNTVSIIGASMSLTIFNGSADAVSGERFMNLIDVSNITLQNLKIQNMLTVASNGAGLNVINTGTNTFTNLEFNACTTSSSFHGGAIYNTNTSTTITGCTFTSNTVPSGNYGGAIHHTSGALTINNSTFTSNTAGAGRAGAIYHTGSTLTISGSTFTSNTAAGGYGGVIYKSGGSLVLTSSTFTSGSAGYSGAIYFVTGSGTSTITSCQFTNNTGTVLHGAIYHNAGTINYSKCKFNGNTSNPATHHNGAAISNWGATFTATNCLFYDNVTSTGGYYSGTVYQNSGTGTLMNCTLTENTGYFIVDNHTSGTFTITNSILYNNISRAYDVYDEGSLTMTYSIYQVETGSAGLTGCNSNTIPYFKAASSDNFMIGASSYAVNNGTSTGAPVDDYDGTTRANGSTTGSGYDIGCYENTCTSGTYYVNNNALTSDVFTSAVGSDSNPGTTGAPFLTLQKALNDCGCTGSIIYVDAGSYADDNMEVANTISIIGAGMSLTSFNGSTDAVSGERFMTLSATGNMTITNMEIKNMVTVSGNGAGLNVINSGTNTFTNLKIDACTVSGAFHGGGMYNTNTGTTITGCTFSNNSAPSGYYGGGIHQTAGALTVSNCTFTGNTAASGRGGGIYHAGTTLTVSGSTFTSNTSASGNGGAIYHGGTALTISNTTFTSNTANSGNGGAINHTSGSALTISSCTFTSNTATGGYGAGIYKTGGLMSLTSNTITGGTAGYGGAIYHTTGSGTSTITSCIFTNNTGTVLHGAVYHNAGTINYSKCKFNGNTSNPATHHNGAAISNWGATFTATNCLFYDNVTSTGGYYSGTVYQNSGTGTLQNCTLTENTGYFIVDNHTTGTFTIKNTILYNNISRAYDVYDEGALTMTYSIYQVETGSAGLTGCTSYNPNFKGASSDDFTIGAASYAVDNGISTGAPTDDYDGTTRANGSTTGSGYDIGCYENRCTVGTYYVNDNSKTGDLLTSEVGSDSNLGTTNTPYLTLRKALNNCGCAGSTIYVDAGTYSDDDLEVSNTVSIIGASTSLTIFNGSADAVSGERFMNLIDVSNITLQNLKIQNMLTVAANGAGLNVINTGTNTFTNLEFNACTTSSSFHGGAIYNTNTSTTITGCTFTSNTVPSGNYGGAIHHTSGALTINNSTFTSNTAGAGRAGAIYHTGSTLTISGSTFTSNTAAGGYGGVIYKSGGSLVLTSSTFTSGSAGYSGAIYFVTGSGTSTITSCQFTNNTGTVLHGAIYHNAGTINYSKCKFNGNTSNPATHHNGAAISNWGATFTATNCLFYDNVTSTGGYYSGTVYQNSGAGTLMNCTLTENTGYFIVDNHTSGTFTITNSILYNNISRAYDVYDEGSLTMTYSIYQVETGSAGLTGCSTSNPLFNNTASDDFMITSSSPALNTGTATGAPTSDFNSGTRPVGSTYDMGCYEFGYTYYWVGGTGNWTDYANHWSSTSGGAANMVTAPNANSAVIFDASSGGGTVTINSSAQSGNFTATNFTGTYAGSSALTINGSLALGASVTWSYTGTTTFASTSTGKTINSAGKTFGGHVIFDGVGGAWSLNTNNWTVTGDVTLTNGTFSLNNLNLSTAGNWTFNKGTFTPGTGTVTFTGASKIISGAYPTTFYNLTVNGATTSSMNTVVTNTLTLGAKLTLSNSTLTLGTSSANGTLSGNSSSNYIVAYENGTNIGRFKRFVNSNTAYVLPIGDATNYTPLTVTLASNGGLSSAYLLTWTSAVKLPDLGGFVTSYLNRYWALSSGGITSPNYTAAYEYATGDIYGTEASFYPVKWSAGTWYKPTGTSFTDATAQGTGSVNTGTNTLTWSSLTSFSLFSAAGNAAVALPVELISFEAKPFQGNVKIAWATANEINNDYFKVERSTDGENFENIGVLIGAGNSTSKLSYFLLDENYFNGVNYYRLLQYDYDGKETVSPIVSVNMTKTKGVKILTVNSIGQEVGEDFSGLVFDLYSDGTSIKRIQ